jgi:large subunit ribosomal protein L18
MGSMNPKIKARLKRKVRIRKKITGDQSRPRLSVFRSARHISAQLIDDISGQTLAAASTYEQAAKKQSKFESKVAAATFVGKQIGKRAMDKGIKRVIFDRNGNLYHGRVKAVSDGAREAGLEF